MTTPQVSNALSAKTLSERLLDNYGLYFPPFQVAAFVTALQAKGFVILSGISGTGKTQLAVRIAGLATGNPASVIPVRPDWRDSRSLLGYFNPISQIYVTTPLLRQLLASLPQGAGGAEVGDVNWKGLSEALEGERKWIIKLQEFVERIQKVGADGLSDADIKLIWLPKDNPITGIGEAAGHKLPDDIAFLRTATKVLTSGTTPGAGIIAAIRLLKETPEVDHLAWARVLRAAAAFYPDAVSALVSKEPLNQVIDRLGYKPISGKKFNLETSVRKQDAKAIDDALHFLQGRLVKALPTWSRYERAVAPWLIHKLPKGQVVTPEKQQDLRFLILDEMNLARVEYYFAEFLSVLESDRDLNTDFTEQVIPLHGEPSGVPSDGAGSDVISVPPNLRLPPGLFVVGTVNTDETTHAFSPKVLDRAFTIEFNDVDLSRTSYGNGTAAWTQEPAIQNLLVNTSQEDRSEATQKGMEEQHFLPWLEALHAALRPYDLHFGYRVRDEIACFVGYAMNSPLADGFGVGEEQVFASAFDAAVLMKVLPKFHGPRARLSEPLQRVLAWAIDPDQPKAALDAVRKAVDATGVHSGESLLQQLNDEAVKSPRLPWLALKTARMLADVTLSGFASFA